MSLTSCIQCADLFSSILGASALFEEVAALEVGVGMDNGVQIRLTPRSVFFDSLDVRFMCPFKDSVASNVVTSLFNILSYPPEQVFVMDTCRLKKPNKIVDGEMSIWAAMGLTGTRIGIPEDLLARVGRISSSSAVDVAADISVSMADIVLVSRIELVVCKALEGLAPEDDTLLERQSDPLEEERVLKTAVMLEMVVLAQRHVQTAHAEWKMLGQLVDIIGCDRSAVDNALALGVCGIGTSEVL